MNRKSSRCFSNANTALFYIISYLNPFILIFITKPMVKSRGVIADTIQRDFDAILLTHLKRKFPLDEVVGAAFCIGVAGFLAFSVRTHDYLIADT